MPVFPWRPASFACGLLAAICCAAGVLPPAGAKEPVKTKTVELPAPSDARRKPRVVKAPEPADFRSQHFLVHTDLPAKEAHELLNRLETMLRLISTYWGHPPAGTIECYVVKDLSVWPEGALEPAGVAKVKEGAGITLVETLNRGRQTVAAKAVVYAVAERGTAQHEAVHAYCGQTFGTTGPLWYAEGMAEMGQYWRDADPSVHCEPVIIKYIHSAPPKPLAEILAEDGVARAGRAGARSGDSWQNYAWRWALCHMLVNNPNYKKQFFELGRRYLVEQSVNTRDTAWMFDELFGDDVQKIAFEYYFFLRHVDQGFRADLCSWDWPEKRKFKSPTASAPMLARVSARRGWQASGVLVESGKQYDFSASGTWQTSAAGPELSPDGDSSGQGRLEGAIFKNYALGEAFPLGQYGTFSAPSDGLLYLRCRDKWTELADNKGLASVRIKNSGQGGPLPRPTRGAVAASERRAKQDSPAGDAASD